MATTNDDKRTKALSDYRKKLLEHREFESKVKESNFDINWVNNPSAFIIKRA